MADENLNLNELKDEPGAPPHVAGARFIVRLPAE